MDGDVITYDQFIANQAGSNSSTGYNTSGTLGNILSTLVTTTGNYLIADKMTKTVTTANAANAVKTQAQIDAENQQAQARLNASTSTMKYVVYGVVALAAVVLLAKIVRR